MHEPAHLPLVLRADGEHVAVVAHGDDALAQVLRLLARERLRKAGADALVQRADARADAVQLRARRVAHLLLGEDTSADLLFEALIEPQPAHDVCKQREPLAERGDRPICRARRTQQRRRREQLSAGERGAFCRAVERVALFGKGLHPADAEFIQRRLRLRRARKQTLRRSMLRLRQLRKERALCLRQHGAARNGGKDLIQFEFLANTCVHALSRGRAAEK